MNQMLIKTHRLEIGALHRRDVMANLDEMGIPYQEHRSFLDSTIIVKIYNERQLRALRIFQRAFKAWQERLQADEDEYNRKELARKDRIELARKNRWRLLTLRKALTSLSTAK